MVDEKYFKKLLTDFNVIFFAVKPQILNKAIIPYKKLSLKNKLIISIVAGKKTKYFERQFGKNVSVIRTMPNLPALVAKGVTCLFKNKNVNLGQKKLSEKLFKSVGDFFWVNNENYINKFTAISPLISSIFPSAHLSLVVSTQKPNISYIPYS